MKRWGLREITKAWGLLLHELNESPLQRGSPLHSAPLILLPSTVWGLGSLQRMQQQGTIWKAESIPHRTIDSTILLILSFLLSRLGGNKCLSFVNYSVSRIFSQQHKQNQDVCRIPQNDEKVGSQARSFLQKITPATCGMWPYSWAKGVVILAKTFKHIWQINIAISCSDTNQFKRCALKWHIGTRNSQQWENLKDMEITIGFATVIPKCPILFLPHICPEFMMWFQQ